MESLHAKFQPSSLKTEGEDRGWRTVKMQSCISDFLFFNRILERKNCRCGLPDWWRNASGILELECQNQSEQLLWNCEIKVVYSYETLILNILLILLI